MTKQANQTIKHLNELLPTGVPGQRPDQISKPANKRGQRPIIKQANQQISISNVNALLQKFQPSRPKADYAD
jgi:hypothetical protein